MSKSDGPKESCDCSLLMSLYGCLSSSSKKRPYHYWAKAVSHKKQYNDKHYVLQRKKKRKKDILTSFKRPAYKTKQETAS